MLFNSFEYALFLPLFFLFYWIIGSKNRRLQNILILVGSYIFYGFWDWRFLLLIFLSSLIDYFAALRINQMNNLSGKKTFLWLSIIWNLGILIAFKYFNFFIENFYSIFNTESSFSALNIILPVGLSFYTFQTMSYTIDVYRGRTKPTSNFIEFLCFVSFFPQLVAGPIERASFLIPQFLKKRIFNKELAKDGLRQILWGLFKKIVVADNLGIAVDEFFNSPSDYQSLELSYSLLLFYFQIYCDFSGYVDIALGSAKLLGFKLHINFNLPHFSKSIPEFWRRWHITLGQWFRDYVHIPFLKNRPKTFFYRNLALLITFALIGLWHGANWSFIIFGLLHALYMIGYNIYEKKFRRSKGPKKSNWFTEIKTLLAITFSLFLVLISIAFFRAEDAQSAFTILSRIFSFIPDNDFKSIIKLKFLFLPLLLILEIITRQKSHPFENFEKYFPKPFRWIIYYIFVFLLIRYGGPNQSFIYFQF